MSVDEIRHFISAWTACVAAFLASLAPSISHFIAAPALSQTLVVRSGREPGFTRRYSSGMGHHSNLYVATSTGIGENVYGGGGHTSPLCSDNRPFCFTHAGTLSPPPSVFTALPVIKNALTTSLLLNLWLCRLSAWTSVQSRAPPAFIQSKKYSCHSLRECAGARLHIYPVLLDRSNQKSRS